MEGAVKGVRELRLSEGITNVSKHKYRNKLFIVGRNCERHM